MIKLEISPFEDRSAQFFSISQARTSIGRNPTNDVVFNHSFISGAHAEILRADDGTLKIKDLGSSNGTFVNDEKITSSPIKAGDKLQFGDLKCRLMETKEEERNFFDSLAISQAKQAMKKLEEGVPSKSSQAIDLESGLINLAAAGETPSEDRSAPADPPQDDLKEPTTEKPAAVSAETETLKVRISELEKKESKLVRVNEALTEKLAEQSDAIMEMGEQVKEKEAALAGQLKETAALRAEIEALQSAHGEVAEACAQLGSIQQEIESYEPERARQQQELNEFLAQAEATKAAALEENARVTKTLEGTQRQLESLKVAIREAQQEEKARIETVMESTRELEERRRVEADSLTQIENQKAAADLHLSEITLTTQAMEAKCAGIETQVAKEEKALKKIHRKIGWRKKLLQRLKTVARREREVAKKMEEAERVLEGVESHHQAGGFTLSQVQPWDVDRARADRDRVQEEARAIQEEVDRVKAELQDRKDELERIEARMNRLEQSEPVHS